jgi:hypothetical protein
MKTLHQWSRKLNSMYTCLQQLQKWRITSGKPALLLILIPNIWNCWFTLAVELQYAAMKFKLLFYKPIRRKYKKKSNFNWENWGKCLCKSEEFWIMWIQYLFKLNIDFVWIFFINKELTSFSAVIVRHLETLQHINMPNTLADIMN